MNLKRLFILPLMALPLMAEGNPFEVSLTGIVGTADLNKMTKNNTGLAVGVALRHELKEDLNLRLHLSLISLEGEDGTGLENKNRPHAHAGFDVMQNVGKWSFFGGITGTQWKQNAITATNANYRGANDASGVKLGYRIGAEYALVKGLRAQASFNQAEFNKVFNPSWYSVGVVWRFQ